MSGLGIWGFVKEVGKSVGDVVGGAWESVSSVIPSGDLLRQGAQAALDVIRTGTAQQVAATISETTDPALRAELERAYLARRARDAAAGAQKYLPLALAGLVLVFAMRRK
jgi:hypothetical protein